MIRLIATLTLTLVLAESRVNIDPLLVSTTSGYLRGAETNTVYGKVRQFLNVPYAPQPIRFQMPIEIDTPNMIRDATKLGPACPQPEHLKETLSPLLNSDDTSVNEACLTLNVYVPEGKKKLPVMVWIPGEGFNYAIPQQFDVSYLALLGEVVVVTVSYRVGVFGFLSTGTTDAPGNLGFWDQRAALKWIKNNVESFGGDSGKVTLFGRFSGAMSITAQMASPLNRNAGLFNRTILQSGIATGKWVFDSQPQILANSLAKEVGCRSEDIVKCMRELPFNALLEKSMYMPWRPTIDGVFLTEDPMESFEKGNVADVDVTIGVNSDEGSLCLLSLYYLNSTYYNKVINDQLTRADFDNLLRKDIEDFTKVNPHRDIQQLTSHEYGNGKDNTLRESYIEFCGAMYITSQMEQAARYLSRRDTGNKVYMYEFDHRPSFSIHPQFIRAAHGDDILFSLGLVYKNDKMPQKELELSRKMIQAFASFANNGTFSFNADGLRRESLPEYDQNNGKIIHFSTTPAVKSSNYDRAANFWHSVIPTISGMVSRSDQNQNEIQITNRTAGYIVGTLLSVQHTEYVLLTLVCLTLVLVVLLSVYPIFLRKRTIKDGMLMDY